MASAQHEFTVITVLVLVFAAFSAYAITNGRAYIRDDLRQQDITHLKQALERYYNVHEYYLTPPNGRNGCTSSGEGSWFFGNANSLLQEQHIDAIPHDVREAKGFVYKYCATQSAQNRTTGYYLEAQLESNKHPGTYFDEDESRKFTYVITQEGARTLYRVCGGNEPLCEPTKK
ncbi:MAG: hypothetical protein HYZ63_00075 [Candidatus Andersenbacteria bacterium]|nr:hypothetical protein [Candidatus Andersenbacteria bacterium]